MPGDQAGTNQPDPVALLSSAPDGAASAPAGPRWGRVLRRSLLAGYAMACLPLLAASLALAFCSVSAAGQRAGIGLLLLIALPFAAWGLLAPGARRRSRLAGLGAWALLALALLSSLPPRAIAPEAGQLAADQPRMIYLEGAQRTRRSWLGRIPEIDQVAAGVQLAGWLDGHIDRQQRDALAAASGAAYRELRDDPAWRGIDSVLDLGWGDMLTLRDVRPNAFVVPSGKPGARPALLFLHGAAGNFQLYPWLWRDLAHRRGVEVICPSGGFGSWSERWLDGPLKILDHRVASGAVERERVVLVALSNGGLGASRLAARCPDRFAALVLISAVPDRAQLESAAFAEGWKGRPILVLSGRADKRVPADLVREVAEGLSARGARVTLELRAGDHFGILLQREAWLACIADWLQREGLLP